MTDTALIPSPDIPRVSVVIPAYNCCELLKICLKCVARQTLPREQFEILVVDDASTDNTADTAEEFARQASLNLIVIRRDQNAGPGAARNSGIVKARAQVIALLDADTEPDDRWLEEGLAAIADYDLVEGHTVIGSKESATPFTHQTQNLRAGGFPTCNMFLRKYVFERVGLFDTRFYDRKDRVHFREDTELALRVIEAGLKTGFAEKAIVIHRPLSPRWNRPLQLAKRYRHDRLLRILHPDTFSDWTDVYEIAGRTFRRLRQKLYWGYLASLVVLPVVSVSGLDAAIPTASALLFLLGIWWLHVRIMGIAAFIRPVAWAALPIVALVPFVFMYSVLKGVWLHPAGQKPLDGSNSVVESITQN